ncbi:toxin-antitoxin system HicB family antitoxin [Novosphingobium sp. FGD1]|uniref:Toxin-antitoxin system HicB family antitoxin n=1 Tax=Novosphingobium silvae TaxID=2692619 RepID=A0A7X4K7P7_9SPHN|nr:type II toxin-antitoxin system HicB family antitoxin [Novosphingobium silvae]MYL98395.1 toxin-antitoxin system HicB family antitoxin [Novosphingobium silvae]
MKNVMTYKGYSTRVEYSPEDGALVGRLIGIQDIIMFEADGVAEFETMFHAAVDDYLESCEELGKEPHKTFSGKVMFRLNPEVHREAAIAAEIEGKSLNEWAENALHQAATHRVTDDDGRAYEFPVTALPYSLWASDNAGGLDRNSSAASIWKTILQSQMLLPQPYAAHPQGHLALATALAAKAKRETTHG